MYRILAILVLAGAVHSRGIVELTTTSTAKPAIKEIRPTTFIPPPNLNETSCVLNGEHGVCVLFFLCNDYNINNDGGEALLQLGGDVKCPSYVDVCCLPSDQIFYTEMELSQKEPLKTKNSK